MKLLVNCFFNTFKGSIYTFFNLRIVQITLKVFRIPSFSFVLV